MTKEETKKAAEIMLAFTEGKEIECRMKNNEAAWMPATSPCWDFKSYCYRVKQDCNYRPFKSADEAFQEAKKNGFWVCDEEGNYRQICYIYNKGIEIANEYTSTYSFDDLFESFVWHDTKTPCGILEE